jgi:hypothetical protein
VNKRERKRIGWERKGKKVRKGKREKKKKEKAKYLSSKC